MKVSKEQAEQNRSALLDAASRLYRKHGIDGVGVAQIAREAGLTHGSLYGHFESKEHYAAEACARALGESRRELEQVEAGDDSALNAFFGSYLSERNRDDLASGCAIAALAAESARKDGPVAQTMMRGIETFITLLDERMTDGGRDRAIVTMSMMVGGLILSRASGKTNEVLSRQVLNAVRGAIEQQDA